MSLARLDKQWSGIEDIVDRRPHGPWMYAVTNDRLREIKLS